ncbi:hypothetical protein BBJ28_00010481 [Nothophytophthora sp. Chile5]|nr:hypothetical protein BBJ28_00010481 [Nothophytophthora sp. Chile5]
MGALTLRHPNPHLNNLQQILRCFPHCCPEHINRSYCGSALYVRVELANPARLEQQQQQQVATVATDDPSGFLVFARFEEAQTKFLNLEDKISVNDVTGSLQTEQTPKGHWIEGTVAHASALDRVCLFEINPGARWYYEWESAATKAQRFTKHVLRVYIFQRNPGAQTMLRVVAQATSTEFMVVSYRRAPSEVRAEREALEALRAASDAVQARTHDTSGTSTEWDVAATEVKPEVSLVRQISGQEDAIWQDCKLWECQHADVMVSSKHLAILYHFLCHVESSQFSACLEKWSVLFGELVAGNGGLGGGDEEGKGDGRRATTLLSWTFLGPLARAGTDTGGFEDEMEDVTQDPLTRLVHICADLAGWLVLDSANLELYRRFLRPYGGALLNKRILRTGYVEAVKLMGELVDRFTGWTDESVPASSSSLSRLSEEIVTVVFQYEHLMPLRRVMLSILTSNEMFGMQNFVAQLRTQFLFQQAESTSAHKYMAWKQGSYASAFDGTWAFNGYRSVLAPIRGSATGGVSFGCLLEFVRELAHISIRPIDGTSLEIRSEWNACSVSDEEERGARSAHSGMTLVLDSRPRIFRNFPSGLSSSIPLGTHSYGDYRGKIMARSCFIVEISSWPVGTDDSPVTGSPSGYNNNLRMALRWKLQIHVENARSSRARGGARDVSRLVVKGIAEQALCRTNSRNHVADFQAIPFHRKLQAVEAWYPVYEMKGVYDWIR